MNIQCPRCRNWTPWENNPNRPFCSEACRTRDLGDWADERYRVPDESREVPEGYDEGEEEPEPPRLLH